MICIRSLGSRGQGFDSQRVLYFRNDLFGEGNLTTLLKGIRKIVEGKKKQSTYACTWGMLVSRVAVTTEELSNVCRVRATRGDGIYQDFGIVPHRADANLERVIVKATI